MPTFEIGESDFLLDGRPRQIISGALHYLRVHRVFTQRAPQLPAVGRPSSRCWCSSCSAPPIRAYGSPPRPSWRCSQLPRTSEVATRTDHVE